MVVLRRSSSHLVIDDASVSSCTSTVSVDFDNKQESSSSSSCCSTTGSTKVQFNLALNEAYDNTVMCKEECSSLWYQSAEYKYFKDTTLTIAKAIIQAETNNRAPYSYQRVLERTFEICKSAVSETENYQMLSTVEDRRHLTRWAELAPSRVGMEKWAVRSIAKQRSTRRFEVIDTILDIQETPAVTQDFDKTELLRKTCERITRPSRLFAVAMAQAHAAAVANEEAATTTTTTRLQ